MTIYANIGSNQGDRLSLIEQAVALIADKFKGCVVRRSDFVESEPWGYASPHPFLNLGIAIDAHDDAIKKFASRQEYALWVLDTMQAIEKAISAMPHRNADGTYRDREIDIDIIAIDRWRISTDRLELPHPRAHLRPFVTEPLRQLSAPSDLLPPIE